MNIITVTMYLAYRLLTVSIIAWLPRGVAMMGRLTVTETCHYFMNYISLHLLANLAKMVSEVN